MFEDLWPAYGDYDFNDLVVNYKMQLYPNNKNMVKEMILGIRVKAIGGSLPYDLCLAIKGIKAGEIVYDGPATKVDSEVLKQIYGRELAADEVML